MNAELVKKALEKVLNPNVLVNMISQRVRQLNSGYGGACNPMVANTTNLGMADIALREIIEDKIGFEMPEIIALDATDRPEPKEAAELGKEPRSLMSDLASNIKKLSSLIHNKFTERTKLSRGELSDLRTLLNVQLARAEDLLTKFPTSYLRAASLIADREPYGRVRGSVPNINGRRLYVIQWKCNNSGKVGSGSILLEQDEADHLAAELNRDAFGLRYEAVCPPAS